MDCCWPGCSGTRARLVHHNCANEKRGARKRGLSKGGVTQCGKMPVPSATHSCKMSGGVVWAWHLLFLKPRGPEPISAFGLNAEVLGL